MASQEVRILAIRGNTLMVESQAASACGSCQSKSQCGQDGKLAREILLAPGQVQALQVFDTICLELPAGQILRMAMSVYMPPMLGLLLGLLPGVERGSDGLSLLGAALGFTAGLLLTRFLGRRRVIEHLVVPRRAQSGPGMGCAG